MKKNEEGIVNAASEINKSLEIISIDEIKDFNRPIISCSDIIKEKFNILRVAEPFVFIFASKYGKNSELIHKKGLLMGLLLLVNFFILFLNIFY